MHWLTVSLKRGESGPNGFKMEPEPTLDLESGSDTRRLRDARSLVVLADPNRYGADLVQGCPIFTRLSGPHLRGCLVVAAARSTRGSVAAHELVGPAALGRGGLPAISRHGALL